MPHACVGVAQGFLHKQSEDADGAALAQNTGPSMGTELQGDALRVSGDQKLRFNGQVKL
jgi:hypothetical protein